MEFSGRRIGELKTKLFEEIIKVMGCSETALGVEAKDLEIIFNN